MAKASVVNIDAAVNQASEGLYQLNALLLANGWTLYANGNGTLRSTVTNYITSGAAMNTTNTWWILTRGSVWITVLRGASASTITIKVAVVAPATVGSGSVPDSQVTAANETTLISAGALITGTPPSVRCHAITYDGDQNVAGIRSFYLFFTDGTSTLLGAFALEAMANGTYAAGNSAPYAVAAAPAGAIFSVSGTQWQWWYSPTSVWAVKTIFAQPYTTVYIFGSAGVGVDPWDGKDLGVQLMYGRGSSQSTPGLVGLSNTLRLRGVVRGYPSTVNLASDAFVYAGECLVPWQNGTTPV